MTDKELDAPKRYENLVGNFISLTITHSDTSYFARDVANLCTPLKKPYLDE